MSSYGDFLDFLRFRESTYNPTEISKGGYLGHYQLGEQALVQIGYIKKDGNVYNNNYSGYQWLPSSGVTTSAEFLANPDVQQKAVATYHKELWRQLEVKGADRFIGQKLAGDIPITQSTLIAASHLKGANAVAKWLKGDRKTPLVDGNNVDIVKYMKAVATFDVGNFNANDSGQFNLYFKLPKHTKEQVGMSKVGSYAQAKNSYTVEELQKMAGVTPKKPSDKNDQSKLTINDLRNGKKIKKADDSKEDKTPAKKAEKSEKADQQKETNKQTIDALRKGGKTQKESSGASKKAKVSAAEKDELDSDVLANVIAQSFNNIQQMNKLAANSTLPALNSVLSKPNTLDLLFKQQSVSKVADLMGPIAQNHGQLDKQLLKQLWPLADQV